MNRSKFLIIVILMLFGAPFFSQAELTGDNTPVIVMCRPTIDQINNIVVMKNEGLLGDGKIRLICVYHERELTDYAPSRKYVSDKRIKWVSFAELKGMAGKEDLFRENIWTSQFREIFEISDGIIFTGGMDIPPGIYGEENTLLTEATTPYRTLYESSFLFHLIGGSQNNDFHPFLEEKPGYPVLGICLGAQTMNIAAGGSLVQDIPSEVYGLRSVEQVLAQGRERIHSSRYIKAMFPGDSKDIAPAFHRVRVTRRSILLKKILHDQKGFPMVLSSHHQSVKKIGKDLFVAATSIDGKIIEALEHKKYMNVLGVQFHPEYRFLHKGLKFFTDHPDKGKFFSLKNFLVKNPPSAIFHETLWLWFAAKIQH